MIQIMIFASLAVLVWALRGRVVSSSPHCVRCRFDLSETPLDARCPECGAGPPALRMPERRVVRWTPAILATLMLLGIGIQTRALMRLVGSPTLLRVMPQFIIERHATEYHTDEFRELMRRVKNGATPSAAVIERALQERHWGRGGPTEWGTLLDLAARANSLSPPLRDRYIREAILVDLEGHDYPPLNDRYEMVSVIFRPLPLAGSDVVITGQVVSASVDGVPVLPAVFTPADPNDFTFEIPAGGTELTVTWRVTYLDPTTGQALVPDWVHTESFPVTPQVSARLPWHLGVRIPADFDYSILLPR